MIPLGSPHKPTTAVHTENRRSFVRKSLATSVSISFAGLIRAHGEDGGQTTTSDTTAWETTYVFTSEPETIAPGDTTIESWATTVEPPTEVTTTQWDTTIQTSTEETTAPDQPAMEKFDPTGVEGISIKSDSFGVIEIGELRDTGTFDIKWQGKVWWNLKMNMVITSPARGTDHLVIPAKKECFLCTLKNIKLNFKVEQDTGHEDVMTYDLNKAINEAIGQTFNNDKKKDFIASGELTNGVSAEAIHDVTYGSIIQTDNPAPRLSPNTEKVCLTLAAKVVPPYDCHYKEIKWEATVTKGASLVMANILPAITNAMNDAIHLHHSTWTTRNPTFPEPVFANKPNRQQDGLSTMAKHPAEGAACDLPQ